MRICIGTNTPTYNILLIGAVAYIGAIALNYVGNAYEHAGELLNFGAFLAFMGVNLSAFWHFGLLHKGRERDIVADLALPLIGFAFCASIWWNLNTLAKTAGGIWFLIGAAYLAATTRGFRKVPKMIDFQRVIGKLPFPAKWTLWFVKTDRPRVFEPNGILVFGRLTQNPKGGRSTKRIL